MNKTLLAVAVSVTWPAALLPPGTVRAQYTPNNYFETQQGSLPVLIIASHGGTNMLPGVGTRGCGPGAECDTDYHTALLAEEFADQLFLNLRQAPYFVVANVSRTQVDLNRDATLAYDDPNAAPYYDAYHAQIQAFVDEIRTQWGEGLLIDIHGQAEEPATIFRGTKNGLTISHAIDTYGPLLAMGASSLLGQIQAETGANVEPVVSLLPENQVEDLRYNGGFIVQHYGSHQLAGIDAVQLEFGIDYRDNTSVTRTTAKELADATATFYNLYSTALLTVPEPTSGTLGWTILLIAMTAIRHHARSEGRAV